MTTWEAEYQQGNGRQWPNEMLVSWVTRRYGYLPHGERNRLCVLEVGCGVGGNLRFLAESGYNATGIDLSETAVVVAQARGYVALVRDVLRMGFPQRIFDCVLDVTCLQHLTEGEHLAALREVRAVLKPGGRFWSYRLGYGTDYEAVFPKQPPAWLVTKEALLEQFSEAGWPTTPTILRHEREYAGYYPSVWAKYLMVEAVA